MRILPLLPWQKPESKNGYIDRAETGIKKPGSIDRAETGI